MVKSMTGYGRAREVRNGRSITVEVRSVNNRYLDCTIKMPRAYIFAEDGLKSLVQKYVSRGKVDVFVTVENQGAEETVVTLNEPLVKSYLDALRHLMQLGGGYISPEIGCAADVARLPDVLTVTKAEEDLEALSGDLCAVLEDALRAHTAMREKEGARLAEDIRRRLDAIEALTQLVEARSPQTVAEYGEKLLSRMREVLQSTAIDESRILTEAAVFADKVAVDEETVRLRSHINGTRKELEQGGSVGRKLDFIAQEMNREANTILSKANDLEISETAIALKTEIEKVREQIQNIE